MYHHWQAMLHMMIHIYREALMASLTYLCVVVSQMCEVCEDVHFTWQLLSDFNWSVQWWL